MPRTAAGARLAVTPGAYRCPSSSASSPPPGAPPASLEQRHRQHHVAELVLDVARPRHGTLDREPDGLLQDDARRVLAEPEALPEAPGVRELLRAGDPAQPRLPEDRVDP